jgi:hypothetical protein
VIVLSRFAVPETDADAFVLQAEAAIAVLRTKEGLTSLDFGHNLDDRELWTITTRWRDIGSYRRALSGIESKMVVVPLLSRAVDEPSAYDDPDTLDPIAFRGEPTSTGYHGEPAGPTQ